MNTIDIIIPIYNAFEDLEMCLNSIRRHTNLNTNRLILINDNSSDERIRPFLQSQSCDRIIVVNNEKNMGFSNNINIGMKMSDINDVILLNSDTIVTSGWVEKMTACAYSNKFCATVTPLSNNATLCSVPIFCEENTLPEGMSVDEAGEIVEKCSMRRYPRITVANGFCMFIKREVIQKIGYFDAATFGRGYGEENDFCNRAEQIGYCHLMCDDTFIYHSGTKSFVSKEKENYIKAHERILKERYPVQMRKNEEHVYYNPNSNVIGNIANYFDLYNGKKNVLLVGYSDFRKGCEDNVGGTQLHVKHLTESLRERFNIFVAARNYSDMMITAYIDQKKYSYCFSIGPQQPFYPVSDNRMAEVFRNVLAAFRIDLVHIHHVKKISMDIYFEAQKQGIPIITTLHDFYMICPSINLIDANNKVCMEQDAPDCSLCLKEKCGIYEGIELLPFWREMCEDVLAKCELLITPSNSTKDIFSKYYPALKEKTVVISHGMDKLCFAERMEQSDYSESGDIVLDMRISYPHAKNMAKIEGTITSCAGENDFDQAALKLTGQSQNIQYLPVFLDQNNYFFSYIPSEYLMHGPLTITPVVLRNKCYIGNSKSSFQTESGRLSQKHGLRVAFVGGLNEIKGGKIAANLISSGAEKIEWFLFGIVGDSKLAASKGENYHNMGRYHQENLQELLCFYQIDAVCILSIWPETFSYTLSEAVLSGIPVIVTNTGALAERVSEMGIGEVVEIENAEKQVLRILNNWMEDPAQYKQCVDKIRKFEHPSIKQMADTYASLYDKFAKSKEGRSLFSMKFDAAMIYEAGQENAEKYSNSSDLRKKQNEIEQMQREVALVKNTYTWKIVNKLTMMNFPLKHSIYAWLKNKNI